MSRRLTVAIPLQVYKFPIVSPVEVFGCWTLVSGVIRGTSTISSHLMILTYNKYVSQESLTEGATNSESPKSPSRQILKYGLLGNVL